MIPPAAGLVDDTHLLVYPPLQCRHFDVGYDLGAGHLGLQTKGIQEMSRGDVVCVMASLVFDFVLYFADGTYRTLDQANPVPQVLTDLWDTQSQVLSIASRLTSLSNDGGCSTHVVSTALQLG